MATTPKASGNPLAKYDQVYDLYRNCVLNELYYGTRLNLFSRTGFWLEIVIVVGSGTSGVAGWIIWTKYPAAAALWGVIAGTATLLAALKPVLQTDAKIKRYSSLFSAYRQLAISMKVVVDEIAEAGEIPPEIDKEIARIRTRYKTLAVDDDPRPSPRLVEALQSEVNRRIPASSLFWPPAPAAPLPAAPMRAGVAGDADAVDVRIDPVEPWPHGGKQAP